MPGMLDRNGAYDIQPQMFLKVRKSAKTCRCRALVRKLIADYVAKGSSRKEVRAYLKATSKRGWE